MKEISSKTGSDYDRTAVQRLREAHGIVLPLLADVKVGTRNDAVRGLRHRGCPLRQPAHRLPRESTGLVDYTALPESPVARRALGVGGLAGPHRPRPVLVACLLAASGIGATLRGRNRAKTMLPPVVAAAPPRVATAASLIALPGPRIDVPGVTDTGPRHTVRR